MREWPIARRLTGLLVLVSALVLLLTSAAFGAYTFWSYRSAELERMAVRGRIMALSATAALAFDDVPAASELLTALRADPHVLGAALYDAQGVLFAIHPPEAGDALIPDAPGEPGYRFEGGRLVGYETVAVEGGTALGTLYMTSDLGALYDTLRSAVLIGMLVFALSVGAAWGISTVLQRSISGPILALAEAARAVSSRRDYSVRATEGGGGELTELTAAFNHMLSRIEEQDRELRAHATDLERRVEARTADLAAANDSLRQQTAELQVANAELDAFAYSVSHDLRAPLRSIDGFSQVVLEDYADELDEAGRDALSRVRAASQRMGALIDDLLRLSRISRAPMKPERVDVSALATDIVAEIRKASPQRSVDVRIEPGLEAKADRRLLEVALDNLIRNAWKYTGKQPEPRIEIGTARTNGTGAFMIRDNGAGFDMAYADKLFGAFQRLHTQEEFEGTGVGLATVRRIIHRHGGEIWAEAAVGEGATFYFNLATQISP